MQQLIIFILSLFIFLSHEQITFADTIFSSPFNTSTTTSSNLINWDQITIFDGVMGECNGNFDCHTKTVYDWQVPTNAIVSSFTVQLRGVHNGGGGALYIMNAWKAPISECGQDNTIPHTNSSTTIPYWNTTSLTTHTMEVNNLDAQSNMIITPNDINNKNYCINLYLGNNSGGSWLIDGIRGKANYIYGSSATGSASLASASALLNADAQIDCGGNVLCSTWQYISTSILSPFFYAPDMATQYALIQNVSNTRIPFGYYYIATQQDYTPQGEYNTAPVLSLTLASSSAIAVPLRGHSFALGDPNNQEVGLQAIANYIRPMFNVFLLICLLIYFVLTGRRIFEKS